MKRIVLVGCRGSGKSTVGPVLAARLGWTFQDADAVLEAEIGMSIVELFATQGESHFRELEAANLKQLLKQDSLVLATGGGIVGRDENRRLLKAEFTVWLDVPAELAYERMQADPTTASRRPNLTAAGGLEEMKTLIATRTPLYESVATLRLDASGSPESIADRILQEWHSSRKS